MLPSFELLRKLLASTGTGTLIRCTVCCITGFGLRGSRSVPSDTSVAAHENLVWSDLEGCEPVHISVVTTRSPGAPPNGRS